MKKILFPTDFSETSFNAFGYALDLANNQNAEILVLHVYDLLSLTSSRVSPDLLDTFRTNIELKEFESFRNYVRRFREIATENNREDINLNFILERGELLKIIQEKVPSEKIDLIVMGTNNDTDFETSILGTNTINVILNTNISVLCVPIMAKFKLFHTIAFSTSFRPEDVVALENYLDIAMRYNCNVKCIYVDNKNKSYDNVLKAWRETFKDENLDFVVLKQQNAVEAVVNYIKQENIGLIATVKDNKTFFESLFNPSFTSKLAKKIDIPLLVLRDC